MPHKIRLNSFPKVVLDRKYQVDGNETDLREFLKTNFYTKDVNRITPNEVRSVIDLEVGQSIFVNIVEVKRLS